MKKRQRKYTLEQRDEILKIIESLLAHHGYTLEQYYNLSMGDKIRYNRNIQKETGSTVTEYIQSLYGVSKSYVTHAIGGEVHYRNTTKEEALQPDILPIIMVATVTRSRRKMIHAFNGTEPDMPESICGRITGHKISKNPEKCSVCSVCVKMLSKRIRKGVQIV